MCNTIQVGNFEYTQDEKGEWLFKASEPGKLKGKSQYKEKPQFKIIEALDKEMSKSMEKQLNQFTKDATKFLQVEDLEKSKRSFPLGTIRDWGGEKYIKDSPKEWKRLNYSDYEKFINEYKGWSQAINNSLRNNDLSKKEKLIVNKISEAINLFGEKYKGEFYRGVDKEELDFYLENLGKEVRIRNFLSTSKKEEIAKQFVPVFGKKKGGRVLRIIPNGKVLKLKDDEEDEFGLNEEEFIFDKNSTFLVEKIGDEIILRQN